MYHLVTRDEGTRGLLIEINKVLVRFFRLSMAPPGGNAFKESNSTGLDYEVKMSKVEANNKPARYGIHSSNGVYELLQILCILQFFRYVVVTNILL